VSVIDLSFEAEQILRGTTASGKMDLDTTSKVLDVACYPVLVLADFPRFIQGPANLAQFEEDVGHSDLETGPK
jgi:hypothetical protein